MKNFIKLLLVSSFFIFASCGSDDDDNNNGSAVDFTGNVKIYTLGSVIEPLISGTATFREVSDGSTVVELQLQNTPPGGNHPAHIHFNTAIEGGGIAVSLNAVDGNTGESSTSVNALDDGTPITYEQLLDFNGYINVHLSQQDLASIVAQGDIGQNELTGVRKVYTLSEKDVNGISGTVEFAQRLNNSTLVTIDLDGTPSGGSHPAHIHQNDAATGGDIIVGLNPVNGDTGISKTQVASLVGGSAVSYDDFLSINAYVNVHLSDQDLATIVAQGNIGVNENLPLEIEATYTITNNGTASYMFNGGGFTDSENPDITLTRGKTYVFEMNTPGHPFYINSVQGTGTSGAFSDGVTNNGSISGKVIFEVPGNAPNTLYYNCEFHTVMTGTINIID